MGGTSQGVEPVVANCFVQKSAKGTFIRKNKYFLNLMENKYADKITNQFWDDISQTHKGSVQHLEFLTQEEKDVFLTAYEINQLELVKNAAEWQKNIDQGISVNLFFPADAPVKWINNVHIEAWQRGLKSLYYLRTESIASRHMSANTFSTECVACEG
jgi:ribonucleoside-diphosphate reductase alpha chain